MDNESHHELSLLTEPGISCCPNCQEKDNEEQFSGNLGHLVGERRLVSSRERQEWVICSSELLHLHLLLSQLYAYNMLCTDTSTTGLGFKLETIMVTLTLVLCFQLTHFVIIVIWKKINLWDLVPVMEKIKWNILKMSTFCCLYYLSNIFQATFWSLGIISLCKALGWHDFQHVFLTEHKYLLLAHFLVSTQGVLVILECSQLWKVCFLHVDSNPSVEVRKNSRLQVLGGKNRFLYLLGFCYQILDWKKKRALTRQKIHSLIKWQHSKGLI